MSLQTILPPTNITVGEITLLGEIFKHPVVTKYLMELGRTSLAELASITLTGKNAEDIARIHARVQGRLETLDTLLSIQTTDQGPSNE